MNSAPTRSACGLLLLTLGLTGCGASSEAPAVSDGAEAAQHSRYLPTPDPDPFYAPPTPLLALPPGSLLRSREVRFAPLGLPLPYPAWQLQYLSTDVHGRPQAQTAVVVQPLTPALSGQRPLLSYHFFTDSLGLQCQPTRQVTGSLANRDTQVETLEYLPQLLALGWTLIFPDYQGPDAAFGVGRVYAPIILDGIRAAESFEPLGLAGRDTPVGMMGYSGGAIATGWAAALQPRYAPELNLVGVAAGGLPANLEASFPAFEAAASNFKLAFSMLIGIQRAYPQFLPPGLLNAAGERSAEAVKDGCGGATTDGSAVPTGLYSDYLSVEDFYATPGARQVFPLLDLKQAGVAPSADVYLYHQEDDELVPVEETAALADHWCAAGTPVHFQRASPGNHTAGGALAVPGQWLYLLSRFAGATEPVLPPGTESCN
ncbi:lipase family protein [Stagnimonas aquatica]|uniref:lipase family protein n=1 Tax=Stagnimonas aquatica TaxID=2689987 RepID=UPI0013157632|nr:lipase family protein [Stagnimonas aquatica]